MTIFDKLIRYARLKPSEEKNFRLLFFQSMLSGFGTSFYFVVVSSYFIKKMTGIANLPMAYIYSGLFGFLLTALYKKMLKRSGAVSGYSSILITFVILSVSLYLCRLFFPDSSPVSLYIAYIGFVSVLPLVSSLALGFSTITLKVLNISQSKRLLALIGTGEVVASLIAYLLVPLLTKLLGDTTPLLLFSAAANFYAILTLKGFYTHNKEKLDSIKTGNFVKSMNLSFFIKNRFYLLIAVVTVFSVLAVYFIDYSYLISVRYIAGETGFEIATIVAVIFSLIRSGELIFSLMSGSIISSRGMKFALLLQPVMLLGSSLIAFLSGIIFTEIPFYVVAFLLFNKWSVRVISKAFTTPSMKVLYQVAEPEDRPHLQTAIDGTLNQYATVFAGILLLVITSFFSNKGIVSFLILISVVCIITFTIWSWFTFELFTNYKLKIKQYLHHLVKSEKKNGIIDQREDEYLISNDNATIEYHPLVKKAMDDSYVFDSGAIDRYISYYNPALKNFDFKAPSFIHILKRAYYNNENFFSRLLIIWHIGSNTMKEQLNFVKEFYNVSELHLKIQIIKMLNRDGFKPGKDDVYYFTGLCEECVREIIWTASALNDISGKVDQKLIDALTEHDKTLQHLLFELLKALYEHESIKAIQDNVNSKDQSLDNQLFALELLDNILEEDMKRLIMPLFEDISFNAKREKLQKTFLIYHLSCQERLKEMLMTNFMTVSPYIKQLALEEYYRQTNDKSILSAFASSSIESLSATSRFLLNNNDVQIFQAKLAAIENLKLDTLFSPLVVAYFAKWGLFTSEKKGRLYLNKSLTKQTYQLNDNCIANISSDNNKLSFDTLGMSLMFRMKDMQAQ